MTFVAMAVVMTVWVENSTHTAWERERERDRDGGGREGERGRERDESSCDELKIFSNLQNIHVDTDAGCDQHDICIDFKSFRMNDSQDRLINQYPCDYPDNCH